MCPGKPVDRLTDLGHSPCARICPSRCYLYGAFGLGQGSLKTAAILSASPQHLRGSVPPCAGILQFLVASRVLLACLTLEGAR
jgi:hypothetical protein